MVVALILLVVVYALIMTEIIHRTSAALLGASLGVAALSILNMVSSHLDNFCACFGILEHFLEYCQIKLRLI